MIFPRPRHTDIPQAVACNANHPSWFTSHEEVRSPDPSHPIPSHPWTPPSSLPFLQSLSLVSPSIATSTPTPTPTPLVPIATIRPPPRLIDKRTHLSPKEPQFPPGNKLPFKPPTPLHHTSSASRAEPLLQAEPNLRGLALLMTRMAADVLSVPKKPCLNKSKSSKSPPREESFGSASL